MRYIQKVLPWYHIIKKKMCLLRYHLFLHWDLNNLDLEEKKSSPFSFSTHQKIGFNVT